MVLVTWVVPRRYFMVSYIVATCFVPADQRIIIIELDFPILRILVVAGVLRIFFRQEQIEIKWNILDKIVLIWAACGSVIYVMLWQNMSAVIYKSGVMFDVIGLYWMFRQYVRSRNEIDFIAKVFAICALVLAPLLLLEWSTGNNPFVYFGTVITHARAGRIRCQGAFPHAIMCGLFWATLTPLFVGMAIIKAENRMLYCSAALASTFAVIASASSTPLMALFGSLAILCLYKWRYYSNHAWVALFVVLLGLHICMKAPVWHLISRIQIIGGSTGWHRFNVIDQAIKHFDEWALVGTRTTEHWGWMMWDVTNQFVLEGVRGGILTLSLFMVKLAIIIKTLTWHFQRPSAAKQQMFTWVLFAVVCAHCISFFGVSYFGQIMVLWYLVLAMVGYLAGEKARIQTAARFITDST
ncbi:MAG: hypothetical protein DRP65_02300 [Planctomycetota bacterium]|nr:MAG: hypothetical protein DRP65_02300 [Planctomycetota bacterium]